MFVLSLTICEIFAKQEKCKNFDLENEGEGVEERDLGLSTGNVRFHIAYSFSDFFSTREHTLTGYKRIHSYTHTHTHRHTHTHSERQLRKSSCHVQ